MLHRFVQARPAAPEGRAQRQFRKGVERWREHHGVTQLEQGISRRSQPRVDLLTKRFQSVKVLGGSLVYWHTPILPLGGWPTGLPPFLV